MLKKNDEFVALVSDMGTSGEGIVKTDDSTIFVPFVLPGEKVRIRIVKQKQNIAYGKALEVLVPAEERVRPQCNAFRRCGGCQLQHLKYSHQLRFKSKSVQDTLRKIGNLSVKVPLTQKCDYPYGYRNKLQLPIGVDAAGNNVVGFYASRSHTIIPISECPIHPDWAKSVIDAVQKFMEKCGVDGYDEEKRTGALRHIVVRELSGRFLITLVSATKHLEGIDYFIGLLQEIFKEFTLWLNINRTDTNVVFGDEFILLYGDGTFSAEEGGVTYEAGVNTFVQVNENIRRRLYSVVVRSICDPDAVVIDGYSGSGLMTAMLAEKCKKAYGIEVMPEAVRCADALKQANGLQGRMENICGTVEEKLPALMEELRGEDVRLVLDPPRKGIERSVIETILSSGVKQIAMVSCNPATLARDLGLLCGSLQISGNEIRKNPDYSSENALYTIESIQPFDMFPQTKHVETLVTLFRKKPMDLST